MRQDPDKILDVSWLVFSLAQERTTIPGPADPMDTDQCHIEFVTALQQHTIPAARAAMAQHDVGITRWIKQVENTGRQIGL